jgi:hypothetical protein
MNKQDWEQRWEQANAFLLVHAGTCERFRDAAEAIFRPMWDKVQEERSPVMRRPNISLRLIADPTAKLLVLPKWSKAKGLLHCADLRLEFLTETLVETPDGDARNWSKRLEFDILPKDTMKFSRDDTPQLEPNVFQLRRYGADAVEVLRRAVAVMDDFLDDRRAVFARSHDSCCVCGRHLTDEQSRSRGIGPECIKTVDFFLYLTAEPKLVLAE